jgi:hypothetical protein
MSTYLTLGISLMIKTLSILAAAFLIVSPADGQVAEEANPELFGLAGRVDRAVAEAAAFRTSDRYAAAGSVLDAFSSSEPAAADPYVRLALSERTTRSVQRSFRSMRSRVQSVG